ncbi:MAG: hypothetical protein GX595_16315, partial [Lentisphaerae bacterium]|nr:hypothetical protein [Lentisphaerota bacterium]
SNVSISLEYGHAENTRFVGNTFVKVGPDRTDYATIRNGYYQTSINHYFYDSKFEGGASYDAYRFVGSGTRDFYVGWTLGVSAASGSTVTITDKNGTVAYSGTVPAAGKIEAQLREYRQLPTSRTYYTPYTVRVTTGGVTTTYTTAAKPEVRLEFTAEPSNTTSTPSLPAAANLAVLEDREFWADVYVRSNAVLNTWVFGGSLNMGFNPAYGRVVAVEPVGEHWQSGSNGTVNNTTGTITGITRTTGAPIGGDDEWVLFARVKFSGKAPVNEAAAQFGPYNMNASMTPGSFSMPFGSATPTVAAGDGAYIYPVIYDVDDNGQILSGDMAVFSAAYRSTVGQLPEPPYTRWADFDGNGKVLGGDLALLSAVYRLSTSQVSFEQMPARYRPPTWVSGWWTRVPAFLPLSEPVSEPVATSAQVVQSPTTLTGSPTPAIILGPGQLKLSRLRAARFGF